jgi:hypothetical protein
MSPVSRSGVLLHISEALTRKQSVSGHGYTKKIWSDWTHISTTERCNIYLFTLYIQGQADGAEEKAGTRVDAHKVSSPTTSVTSIIMKPEMAQQICIRTTGTKVYQTQSNDFRSDIA